MIYFCCDHLRRAKLAESSLNGIDYVEVLDHDAKDPADRQKKLFVHFVNKLATDEYKKLQFQIEGGERNVRVTDVKEGNNGSDNDKVVTLNLDNYGNFSIYTLCLVRGSQDKRPPKNFDPRFAAVDFSFKVQCPTDFDCLPVCTCPPKVQLEPDIDYLAKDYDSFRRLMLDRMSALLPQWRERNTADLGMVLAEALAYSADHLSYQQDAIATEAYLDTARRRTSVRRHAKLVDYQMHEGCSARVWVQVQVKTDVTHVPAGVQLLTRIPGELACVPEDPRLLARADEVFETIESVALFEAHNEMRFYSWGDNDCCLPKGARQATLRGHFSKLKAGDVLIFEEVKGPRSGESADANPAQRCAVRLNHVQAWEKPDVPPKDPPEPDVPLKDPLTDEKITDIIWDKTDALPFPICVSSRADKDHGEKLVPDVSVARGNLVLADHGQTIRNEEIGRVPPVSLFQAPVASCDRCRPLQPRAIPPRFRPGLARGPLTFAVPCVLTKYFSLESNATDVTSLDDAWLPESLKEAFGAAKTSWGPDFWIQGQKPFWSISDSDKGFVIRQEQGSDRKEQIIVYKMPAAASSTMQLDVRAAVPAIALQSTLGSAHAEWRPRLDLLDSESDSHDFVVEVENDRRAWLRFGDNSNGLRPESGTSFSAFYRVGGSIEGNVGAEAIAHIVAVQPELKNSVIGIRNPMAAQAAVEPESLAAVRQFAPVAFRTQERAVTETDYADVTMRHPEVQRAVATFRWTGSWHTVYITVDRYGGLPVDKDFKNDLRKFIGRYRLAGYDLEIDDPRFISLDIAMNLCVLPDYFRDSVKQSVFQLFNNRVLPDGRRGLFHPDNFTFGQPVYLSPLISAVQQTPGVASVQVTKFERRGIPDQKAIEDGKLTLGRLEIARCDNDPNFPERGSFQLSLGGGK
jgi:hypothetical protein